MDGTSRAWSTISAAIPNTSSCRSVFLLAIHAFHSPVIFPPSPRISVSPFLDTAEQSIPAEMIEICRWILWIGGLGVGRCLCATCVFAWWDGLSAGALRRQELGGQGGDLREQDAWRQKMDQIVDARRQGESEVRGAGFDRRGMEGEWALFLPRRRWEWFLPIGRERSIQLPLRTFEKTPDLMSSTLLNLSCEISLHQTGF